MKQKTNKTSAKKAVSAKQNEPNLNPIYGLILLGYSFITVLTPNLNTLDSNGPKFYTLAIFNLVAYIIILIGNSPRAKPDFHWSFFRTWIGLVYTLFLLVSLLSFFNAFNIYESIINFSKLFTIFSAAYIVSVILRKDKRYLYVISIALALLLIADSFTVFYHISNNLSEGKGPNIIEIKSFYSNKNILAAAIFVKISFVLWLLTFGKGWMKILGGFTLFIAFIATLFMSTRTFYIGIIFLVIAYVIFMFIRYYKRDEKHKLIKLSIFLATTIILSFILFSAGLKYLYPSSTQEGYAVDFFTRLKTIGQNDKTFGYGGRTATWQRSLKLVEEHPLLGVGTGNWKIQILKYETPVTGAYIFMYKNHNDFIETMADTGILGGALFIGIFLLVFASFLKSFFKARKEEESTYTWMFLPAFGLFCYSFDAMFNFPSDRPEIISFFAIFVGAGVAYSPLISIFNRNGKTEIQNSKPTNQQSSKTTDSIYSITIAFVFLSLMVGSIYIFYLNFESLKLQRIVKEEMNAGKLTSKSELFLNEFPVIPDISIEGEPIAVSKARYLIVEEKYQQAIELLKKDNSSPYDTRPEFFIAMAYSKLGQHDSALAYTKKVYALKPYFSGNISVMSSTYEAKGDLTEALKVLDDHIRLNTDNNKPIADVIYQQQKNLSSRVRIQKYQDKFDMGMVAFSRKEYNSALKYFSEFIDKEPGLAMAYEYRAFCNFYLNKYQSSLADIEIAITLDSSKPGYLNLRGVNLQMLGNNPAACADFQAAINLGDKDAVSNYEKFCKKR